MVEVLQTSENFDYEETDRPKTSSGDGLFFPPPALVPSTTATVDANQSINYGDKGCLDLAEAAESHLDPATSRSCSHGNSWMFPGINAVGEGGGGRKAETKKDNMFSPQIMEHLRLRVSEATDASLASARRDLININAIDKLCTHLGLDWDMKIHERRPQTYCSTASSC